MLKVERMGRDRLSERSALLIEGGQLCLIERER